jgi:chromosome segregation ATPase
MRSDAALQQLSARLDRIEDKLDHVIERITDLECEIEMRAVEDVSDDLSDLTARLKALEAAPSSP